MGTLDRYITRQFLTNIALILLFLSLVIIAVDFSLNFDEFSFSAERVLKARGSTVSTLSKGVLAIWLVVDLWWPRMFLLFNFLLGPVLVGAMGFTCASMVKHRELVALLASGVSLKRVARPILIVTLCMVGLMVANREWALPRLAPLLTRDKSDAGSPTQGTFHDVSVDAQQRIIYSRRVHLGTGSIDGLYAYERDAQGLMTNRISADVAVWQGDRWALQNGVSLRRRALDNAGPGARILPVPVATLATDVDPTALQLRRFEGMAANLSTPQVSGLITRFRAQEQTPAVQRRIAGLERNRWGRTAGAASILLTVILCLPFFLRREPANMLRQSLKAAPIALGAFAGVLVGTTAAMPGLPAQVGVFIPVLMLIPGAIIASGTIRS